MILVTGANVGLGFETARQLADGGAVKVILACRNESKGKAAIAKLVALTKKPESTFELLIMDTSDLESVRSAAASLGASGAKLDALVLNAGGIVFGNGKETSGAGASTQFAVNVLGHAAFVEALLASGSLSSGARVMFSSSEAAMGVPGLVQAPKFASSASVEEIARYIDGSAYKSGDSNMKRYAYTKSIGTLYMSALARKHPEVVIMSVSPGGTGGTAGATGAPIWMKMMMKLGPLLGQFHSLPTGAKRYVGAVTTDAIPTGSFYASQKGKVVGKLVDQTTINSMYADEAIQEAAFQAVHRFLPSSR